MYERFCKLLKKSGEKAIDVSRATGINTSVFSDWKSGKSAPKIDKLYKIAQHFNVPLEYFVEKKAKK